MDFEKTYICFWIIGKKKLAFEQIFYFSIVIFRIKRQNSEVKLHFDQFSLNFEQFLTKKIFFLLFLNQFKWSVGPPCHQFVQLPWKEHVIRLMDTRTQSFPAESCTVMRLSVLFTSPVNHFNVVANRRSCQLILWGSMAAFQSGCVICLQHVIFNHHSSFFTHRL